MTTHYTMFIGCDGAGGDTNLASLNFYNAANFGTDLVSLDCAQLIAYAQYLLPAENCYIAGISAGGASEHGQFPQDFPVSDYADLVADDVNLVDMDEWGVRYGFNDLTARGIGAVITKKTNKLGRHGRGRLTTPWLPISAVTATGQLLAGSQVVPVTGWNLYMAEGKFGDLLKNVSETPYLQIQNITVSSRLGHVRSRTQ